MDPELIAYLDERFRGIDASFTQQIEGLREETSQRFDKMEDQLRLTDVKVEDLRGQIQLVAEGVAAGNESLKAFRETVALEFASSRSNVNSLFKDLNQRVRDLELRSNRPSL
jgi:hypothetical protein